MFDFSTIDEVRLARGAHESPSEGLCFMEMVAWFEGEAHGDKPKCACPVLGAYGITINDSMPDDVRDRLLKPLVPLIAGTADPASEQKRAEFLVMWAVNKVLPIALRAAGIDATDCERADDLESAHDAASAAYAAGNAAANAAYAAANAAYAAGNAAYAAGNAAAAAAYAAGNSVWPVAVEGLRQAIFIGRHDGFTVPEPVLIERKAKLKEIA